MVNRTIHKCGFYYFWNDKYCFVERLCGIGEILDIMVLEEEMGD